MTQLDFTHELASELGIKMTEAEPIVQAFKRVIKNMLLNGEKIKLQGLGTLGTKKRSAITGKNNLTGEPMAIPEGIKTFFTCSTKFRNELTAALS